MGVGYTPGRGPEDVQGVKTPSNRFEGGPDPKCNREEEGCHHVNLLSVPDQRPKDRL
jgi:hypothetical protein